MFQVWPLDDSKICEWEKKNFLSRNELQLMMVLTQF